MSKILCHMPFSYCEINDVGEVNVCCGQWCSGYVFGNILENDYLEIINGSRIEVFINQFETQKFKYCNFEVCPAYKKYDSDEEYNKDYDRYTNTNSKTIRLNFDRTCNLNCVFCGSKFQSKDIERSKLLLSKIKKHLPYFNENNYEISLNGVGEIFVSQMYKDFVREISTNYSNIKFHIITNGILCSRENLKELGIIDRLSCLEISLHAMKEKTYKKIVIGGNFKKVRKNILYASKLVKNKKVKDLLINFTVTSINYKEMVDFAKWCIRLGAKPNFLPLVPVKNIDFEGMNIADPNHSLHSDFVRVMQNPIFKNEKIIIPRHYLELKPTKKTNFLAKLLKLLKSCPNLYKD